MSEEPYSTATLIASIAGGIVATVGGLWPVVLKLRRATTTTAVDNSTLEMLRQGVQQWKVLHDQAVLREGRARSLQEQAEARLQIHMDQAAAERAELIESVEKLRAQVEAAHRRIAQLEAREKTS